MHDRRLVDNSLNAWQPLTKALEKEQELLKMVIRIGSTSEAWRALTKIANASEEVECDRAKREFETLEMDASESVAEFFTRVHIILMELERHQMRGSTIGKGGDTTISSPGRSPKQPLPGIGLHDPLHGEQACPEFIVFDQGVGQICPR